MTSILVHVLPVFLALAESGPGDTSLQTAAPSQIRGIISWSSKLDTRYNQARAALFGRYADHGWHDAALVVTPSGTATWRFSERAVVYLEAGNLDTMRSRPPAKHPALNQKNLQFHPEVLPVVVGTTVDFPNRDNLFHNVFSYSQPKEFDLGRYPKDDSRSVTFDRPGVVRVYCDIHSHMNATILVLRNPYFATPEDDGSYVIPDVPPGKYTAVLWYDRGEVERRAVEVKAGETVVVNFSI